MQPRRFRPGDVLDDYCPRERRITDHAIVAMIEDHIKQTRCVVCDAEHEYKEGKVPAQRRKRPQAALFTQVLDGLQGPTAGRLGQHPDANVEEESASDPADRGLPPATVRAARPESGNGHLQERPVAVLDAARRTDRPTGSAGDPPTAVPQAAVRAAQEPASTLRDEGSVRRSLIRATLPRPEGQPLPARVLPEFTIRQPHGTRAGHKAAGGRRGGHQPPGQGAHGQGGHGHGAGRFGRGGQPHGQGQRQHGGGRRRGGKKR